MPVEVLVQGSAGGNVDHLHTATDPEHRHSALGRELEELHLGLVAGGIDAVSPGVSLGSITSGIDVAAAWQDEAVDMLDDGRGGAGRQQHDIRAGNLHRVDVLLIHAMAGDLAAAKKPARDPDQRPRPHEGIRLRHHS
jgi:hypothetical protein